MKKCIKISTARGNIVAPPSKSYAHRILICSGLSQSDAFISNIEMSNDIIATLNCLKVLGYDYQYNEELKTIKLFKSKIDVTTFDCLESGSTLRFMIPLAASILNKGKFIGTKRLLERGLGIYEDIFKEHDITYSKTDSCFMFEGKLKPGTFNIVGNISSQFISGLLFSLPLLDGDSIINIIPPVESVDYIKITIDVLRMFAIEIIDDLENNKIIIKGNQVYQVRDAFVEGDYSNAAFLDAFNYIGGNVIVTGLNENSLQGDSLYKKYFEILKNNDMPVIDISNTIDLGPILFVMASLLNGAKFTGTKRLQIKESDRVKSVCDELAKFGVDYEINENYCIIKKSVLHKPILEISSHNDHRLVMAFSVMLSKFGGVIDGTDAVNKSYPTFFECIKGLGIEVQDE